MKSYIKLARQPEVIRTTQKDLQYTSEINQNVLEIAQFLSRNGRSLIKWVILKTIWVFLLFISFKVQWNIKGLIKYFLSWICDP